jgi:hypothetical protein
MYTEFGGEKEQLKDLGVNGKKILKMIFNR